mmetsp:Transcript_33567/g.57050  ORF Transcript_33567/g.57050 Transcript_33567/m.57050 type:complete len:224 (+) Transcript_33567:109-780(+)
MKQPPRNIDDFAPKVTTTMNSPAAKTPSRSISAEDQLLSPPPLIQQESSTPTSHKIACPTCNTPLMPNVSSALHTSSSGRPAMRDISFNTLTNMGITMQELRLSDGDDLAQEKSADSIMPSFPPLLDSSIIEANHEPLEDVEDDEEFDPEVAMLTGSSLRNDGDDNNANRASLSMPSVAMLLSPPSTHEENLSHQPLNHSRRPRVPFLLPRPRHQYQAGNSHH